MKDRRIVLLALGPAAGLAGAWIGLLLAAFGPAGLTNAGAYVLTPTGLGYTGAAYLFACVTTLPMAEPRDPPLPAGKALAFHGLVYLAVGGLLGLLLRTLSSR